MMDTLPPEILRLICFQLQDPQNGSSFHDLANLRFLNRSLSLVACEFLVHRVRFHTSYKSLKRLENISEHPIFCRTVKSLVYEAALLADVQCRYEYATHFELDHHGLERPREPPPTSSARECRYFARAKAKWTRAIHVKYDKYRALYQSQRSLLESDELESVLSRSIPRFGHLEHIDVDPIRRCAHLTSRRFVEEFGSECASPLSGNPSHIGDQLQFVFLPHDFVIGTMRKLEVDCLSPTFFRDSRRHRLRAAFAGLTDVDITLKLVDTDRAGNEPPGDCFHRHLANNVLKNALSVAKHLEILSIGIDYSYPSIVIDLWALVPAMVWTQLTQITLSGLSSSQSAFLDLLKSQPKLKAVYVSMVSLTHGNWSDLIQDMREQLSLRTFLPSGCLKEDDHTWFMGLISMTIYSENFQEFSLADAIDMYVINPRPDEESWNPLRDQIRDFEDADLVRDMYGTLSDDDDMSLDDTSVSEGPSSRLSPLSDSSDSDADSTKDLHLDSK